MSNKNNIPIGGELDFTFDRQKDIGGDLYNEIRKTKQFTVNTFTNLNNETVWSSNISNIFDVTNGKLSSNITLSEFPFRTNVNQNI